MDDDPPFFLSAIDDPDPYIDPASKILQNLLGITSNEELKRAEAQAVLLHMDEVADYLANEGTLAFDTWQGIHHLLFQDVYSWAGEPRTINMGREGKSVFNTAAEIVPECTALMDRVTNADRFHLAMGAFYAEMNFQHPFREGNGRTLKCLFSAIALRHRVWIYWEKIDTAAYIKALIFWHREMDANEIHAVLDSCSRTSEKDDGVEKAIQGLVNLF